MENRDIVLSLVAQGMTTNEISKITGLTKSGVRYNRDQKRRESLLTNIRNRRRRIKLQAIEYKGGKCIKCGYNHCIEALVFHHIDPAQKDMKIGSGRTFGWERIRKELDKTILLCNRCHSELHAGLWLLDAAVAQSKSLGVRVPPPELSGRSPNGMAPGSYPGLIAGSTPARPTNCGHSLAVEY